MTSSTISPTINEVKGKVAIVTGAASGIGKATAELLLTRGAKVVAEDINPDVEKLARPDMATLVADVSKDGSAEQAVDLALKRFGQLQAARSRFYENISIPCVRPRHWTRRFLGLNL